MLYLPVDFKNSLKKDVLVDLASYAIAQNELDRIKQQAPTNIFRIDDSFCFHIQVAKGQLEEKPLATAILEFDIGDLTFAERFVEDFGRADYTFSLHETQQCSR